MNFFAKPTSRNRRIETMSEPLPGISRAQPLAIFSPVGRPSPGSATTPGDGSNNSCGIPGRSWRRRGVPNTSRFSIADTDFATGAAGIPWSAARRSATGSLEVQSTAELECARTSGAGPAAGPDPEAGGGGGSGGGGAGAGVGGVGAEPMAVALRPRRMKIVEKLAMNSRLGTSTRRQPVPSSSDGVTPITIER